MVRGLANIVAVLSAVLVVLVLTLWLRSYFRGDVLEYTWAGTADQWHRRASLAWMSGQFSLTRSAWSAPGLEVKSGWSIGQRNPRPGYDLDGGFLGIQHRSVKDTDRWLMELRVPMWVVAAGLSVLPLVVAKRWRRDRERARAGLCPVCGYDLRATPGKCPECGADGRQAAGSLQSVR